MTESLPRTVAIFDFDGTLIEGDSFLPFLAFANGWPRVILALAEAVLRLPFHLGTHDHPRTFFKALLLERLIKGKKPEQLSAPAEKLRDWQRWISSTRRALLDHAAKGHHIVIASGGLDLYLPKLLEETPYHALICTEIENANGVLTGIMKTGNTVRRRKAELVAAYLEKHGPFDDSYGYGNSPNDLPMLELIRNRTII